MTREEWSKHIQANGRINNSTKEWIENLVGEIYDDFESRVCGNCRYNQDNYKCTNNESMVEWLEDIEVFNTFGCNKFERK